MIVCASLDGKPVAIVGSRHRFVPGIVSIEYRAAEWVGNFTYDRQAAAQLHAQGCAPPPTLGHPIAAVAKSTV